MSIDRKGDVSEESCFVLDVCDEIRVLTRTIMRKIKRIRKRMIMTIK